MDSWLYQVVQIWDGGDAKEYSSTIPDLFDFLNCFVTTFKFVVYKKTFFIIFDSFS